jgi:FixJ family two-component response regulator
LGSLGTVEWSALNCSDDQTPAAASTCLTACAWRPASDKAVASLPSRSPAMAEAPATVIVIDDDVGLREALGGLLRSVGLQASLHGSVSEFLEAGRPDGPSCLVLDVRLPGQGGLDFQRELTSGGIHLPIIFITGHGDIPMSVQAMKGGAIEFLTKPFRDQDLLDAIQSGLERDRSLRHRDETIARLRARFNSLTQREREVMGFVVAGRLNKQIAGDIGVSEITVKVHRSSMMRKMEAATVVELVLMAEKLKASGAATPP